MINRCQVLWFGAPATADTIMEAERRHLSIKEIQPDAPDFASACAAVFWATPRHVLVAMDALERYLVSCLNEGLLVQIVVADGAGHDDARRVVMRHIEENSPINVACRIGIGFKPYQVLEKAARHNPGPATNPALSIALPDDVELSTSQEFMLRRAFGDCKSISLKQLAGGKSGAQTFYVDATLATSTAGPKPMPYFAKLDHPAKLDAELRLYQQFAEHHISWHLRPNFQPSRCVYGVNDGILVGNFVENSRSLWEEVCAGRGLTYIRALFNETLVGWREQAQREPLQQPGSVVAQLRHLCNVDRISPARVQAAAKLGAVDQPTTLWRKLINLPHEQWRRSPMHGDMHAENVRVRKSDAIVIDFAKAALGPMCADLASLDVWLSFQVPQRGDRRLSQETWLSLVTEMYTINAAGFSGYASSECQWLTECIAEIRSIAYKACCGEDEYDRILALYLLRHASFSAASECTEEDEYRRTVAYWLANRLVDNLTAKYQTLTDAAA